MATVRKLIGNVRGPQGVQGPQGIQGIQGPTGPTGPTGPVGATPNITIGTVEDVPHESQASATMTGTPEAPVLNLQLRSGASGNETIDDTAGIGDTDLVWSADKSTKEVTDLKSAINNDMRYIVGKSDLLSEAGWNVGAYISATGEITPYSTAKYTNLIPVNGDDYTYYYIASTISGTTRVHGYDSNGDWVAQITTATTGTTIAKKEIAIQTQGYSFIRISESTTITPVVLVDGDSIIKEIADLSDTINTVVSQNLMGSDPTVYYPVDIAPGEKFTISKSDGSIFPSTSTLVVYLYDENKTQTDVWSLKNGETYRTITTNAGRARTKYMKWGETPSVPLMVVKGAVTAPYIPFFDPLQKQIAETKNRITELEIEPQNLVGMQKNRYYSIDPPIEKGQSFTVCVANGEQLRSACDVKWYDSEKTQVGSLRLHPDESSSVAIAEEDIYYIKLDHYPAKLMTIVRGNTAKPYSLLAYNYNEYASQLQVAGDYYKQRIKYPDYFVNNIYVSVLNHLITESSNYVSTNPIPLNKGDVLHYNLSTNGSALISLYDKKTGAFISSPVIGTAGTGVMTEGTYTLEQDAYVIVSHRPIGVMHDSKSYFYINDSVFRKADISVNTSDAISGTFVSGYGTLNGWEQHSIAFSKMMIDTEDAEAFLFFTDSHFMSKTGSTWKPYIYEVFSYIEKLYYTTPCSFVLHGGDWLGGGENREDYMYKLSSIGGAFRRNFDRYALVVGNHETAGQSSEQIRLTHNTLTNTLMSRFGRCYYTFNANTFKMYCFDTWDSGALDDYGKTQLKWFANALTNETESHIVIAMHILYDEQNLRPMGEQISLCAEAYNNRGSFTYDGVTYDYSNATGKVAFIIAGHEHGDRTGTVNNIPFILTVNTTGYGGEANFDLLPLPLDLIKVDWTNSLLTAYRARRDSAGTTRTLQIIT